MEPRVVVPQLPAALRALDQFPDGIRKKWTRIGVSAGVGVLRDAARRHVRKQTRLLEKSLSVKVKVPSDKRRAVYGLVGAKRGMKRAVISSRGRQRALTEKRADKLRQGGRRIKRYRNPTRYFHLLERGHRAKGGGVVQAYPALGEAARTAGGPAAAKAIAKIQEGVAAEAAIVRSAIGRG